MMKILFDGTATQGSQRIPFHGGADYAIYLLNAALEAQYNLDVVLYRHWHTNPRVSSILEKYKIRPIFIDSSDDLYNIIDSGTYSRFYSAIPYTLTRNLSIPFITTIHGLRSVELPVDAYRYKYEAKWYRKIQTYFVARNHLLAEMVRRKNLHAIKPLFNSATRILTDSEHSKYAIKYFFPSLDLDDIVAIPAPVELRKYKKGENRFGKYFLLVNGNRFEKNIYRALSSFIGIFKEGMLEDAKVVVTGGKFLPFRKEFENDSHICLLDYVSNEELESLYANAFALLYPSLNEGYGYPPLIAMANEVPVIASSSTSIPQVCKDGALFFNPLDVADMSNRILQVYYNDSLREELVRKGRSVVADIMERQEYNTNQILSQIFE